MPCQALAELLPDDAERITDGRTETVPIGALAVNDLVLVRPGGRVPADGEVVEGTAEMDESMVTGESQPVAKGVGDRVVAGTVATDSALRVEVRAVGDDTALAGIQRLVAQAQESRSRAQVLADRAAAFLFYVAVAAASVTAAAWLAAGDPDEAVVRTVAVLVIACPHALGLAIPLVISISTGMAAGDGILVKDRLALERMRTVDVVLFDKTGTLTKGSHVLGRCGGRRRRPRPAAGDGRRRRSGLGAPAGKGDRRRRRRAGIRAVRRTGSGRCPAAVSRPPSTARPSPWAVRRCCGKGHSTCRRR